MDVTVRLLGGFEVVVDGRAVPSTHWRRRSAASLVKLLALAPGRRMRRDEVIDALWPDLLVDEAAPRLHKAAHYARTALGARDGVVLADDAVSLLPAADVRLDVTDFEQAAEPDAALDSYAGDLLPDDVYERWTEEHRDRLRLRRLALLRQTGRWATLVAADPLDEEAHLRLVREHVDAGRRAAALRQLQALAAVTGTELGTGLSPAAVALRAEALALPPEAADGGRPVRRTTPLPLPATTTIGRDWDRARVQELLEHSRVVTLIGPGGVGKTRLAVETALERSRGTDTEAAFVDLTRVGDAGLVADLVCSEIGVHVGSADGAERALVEALRRRSLLLVLDNFEHVAAAAPLVSRLAARAPEVTVLVTSRARLHIAGERIYDVPPLPVAGDGAAVALFCQAATAVDPDFDLSAHLADVVAICRQVDGLPLAIELAAGHVRTLSPAALRARLGLRLGSPVGAPRDSPERQLTIPATIDWSLQLLGAPEQELFAALGVFAGPVEVEAVEAVCGEVVPDAVAALSRLVDSSLVRRVTGRRGEPRFRLLELLRQRARELLPEPVGERLRARHAAWVAATLDELDGRKWTEPQPWIDRITDLQPEIRAAHADATRRGDRTTAARIAAAMGTFWHREGHHDEGMRWVGAALRDGGELDGQLLGRLHVAAGTTIWTHDSLAAREHWARAAELFRRHGSDRYLAYALGLTAVTFVGDPAAYPEALRQSDESIALARRVDEAALTAQLLCIKGELTRVHGDDATARSVYEEGRRLAEDVGDGVLLSMLTANLGYLAEHRGDQAEAARLHREGLGLAWAQGRRLVAAWILGETAGPELALGRPEHGARMIGAADRALDDLGVHRAPGDSPEYDRVVAALRAALGDAGYERATADGARLTLDEAVAVALAGPPVQLAAPAVS
ncbi:NB-ARC domain-containing protein [Petropleomorpha daqingensis]|uniref:Putative ATPase/DNA-binding SARP family transcriptional activator n=1 Tax=Petropleomorpha daqingensis TaxID=2026353 RepID=A0A853CQB4_9ACTN|nr:NB-ARC domain-containing protein [Petropleomorpha daqingensis]NYJ08388.1 putative ATPase/DNA-binding SARP family transcriptional activator [Petropleomorpha daqingensis]